MTNFFLYKIPKNKQYIISISLIFVVAGFCYLFSGLIDYKVVAFVLFVTVSLIAMFFDLWPVLIAACLSAIVWDFFFIPPKFTLEIKSTEDLLLFLMYFVIALLNGVLTYKIRQYEKESTKKEEEENTLKLYNTILNSLSHELRTPISTIIGATDNLLLENNNLTEKNEHDLIYEISKASLRLDRQVGNLLNMSRLESGFIQIKNDWCDINELVHDTINQLKDSLSTKKLNLQIKENLPLFKLDKGLLEQILHNLIYNAILYTPKEGVITIQIDHRPNALLITILDNGPGFPEGEIEKVFNKFYRLKNSNTGGTGLGLSIVKGFVEAMKGTVHLENILVGGAKFNIEIPAEISHLNTIKHD